VGDLVVSLAAAEALDVARFGAKAAHLATLGRSGLPVPGGFCLDARAYRVQLGALGLEAAAREAFSVAAPDARRRALAVKLGLLDGPIAPPVLAPLLAAWAAVRGSAGCPGVVRSSALVEDRAGSGFAGQFETFLGLESEAEFLTAVRSCWASLWSTRALRSLAVHGVDPADTAMALLVQPLIAARASGGGLSRTADGEMLLSATWGLGSPIAQGEVVPDRIALGRAGEVREIAPGRKHQRLDCGHGAEAVPDDLAGAPCLDRAQAAELGRLLRRAEAALGGPIEIEWALDDRGFTLLQARPLRLEAARRPERSWLRHPALRGHPAGVGWGTGPARVVHCECELGRVGRGDVLVTRVASPALGHVLPFVSGVVAELGGSTSHLAALARERMVPVVLGVPGATRRIPEGALVAVDGVAGVVRWRAAEPGANGRRPEPRR
jgi:pyruvate,water dikinase